VSYFQEVNDMPMIVDQKTATNEELVLAHLRMVQSIVNKQYSANHPLYDDLIQVGNMALMTAAEMFERENGAPFASYAMHRIKYEIQRFQVDNKFQFRSLTTKPVLKAFYNQKNYIGEDGNLDRQKMASDLDISVADIREMEKRTQISFINLNMNESEDDNEFHIPDYEADPETILRELQYEDFLIEMKSKLEFLSVRERTIIESRYYQDEPLSFVDLGAMFGVSHQRVKQIEQATMKKLKTMLEISYNNSKLEIN
jgi:RNA polymerase sigma-32 factor